MVLDRSVVHTAEEVVVFFQSLRAPADRTLCSENMLRRAPFDSQPVRKLMLSLLRTFTAQGALRDVYRVALVVDPGLHNKCYKDACARLVELLSHVMSHASKDQDAFMAAVEVFLSPLIIRRIS